MRIIFHSKLKTEFMLVIFFLFLLPVIQPVRYANADTCMPNYVCAWFEREILEEAPYSCPNSGLACTFGVLETRHGAAWCVEGINLNTTISPCRGRAQEEPVDPYWYWSWLGHSTLNGPCFPVVGTAPCGDPNEVTIWYQWVEPLGTEAACDPSDCFFCENNVDDPVIDCGLENDDCPD